MLITHHAVTKKQHQGLPRTRSQGTKAHESTAPLEMNAMEATAFSRVLGESAVCAIKKALINHCSGRHPPRACCNKAGGHRAAFQGSEYVWLYGSCLATRDTPGGGPVWLPPQHGAFPLDKPQSYLKGITCQRHPMMSPPKPPLPSTSGPFSQPTDQHTLTEHQS